MPCKGPCGKAKDGSVHYRYSADEQNPSCVLDGGHNGPCSWTEEYKRNRLREKLDFQLLHNNTKYVTGRQMLCSACRALERFGYDFDENPALSQWWEEHKRFDNAQT